MMWPYKALVFEFSAHIYNALDVAVTSALLYLLLGVLQGPLMAGSAMSLVSKIVYASQVRKAYYESVYQVSTNCSAN